MALPKLQLALDVLSIEAALQAVQPVRDFVDIIEVGTVLLAAQGHRAIRILKAAFPEKIIVADGKIADAASVFGPLFFDSGAHYITAICAAETATIAQLVALAQTYNPPREVQVELTSHFNWQQVSEWRAAGVTQVVYHRARDVQAAGKTWSTKDLETIRALNQAGFKVTVAGGIMPADIKLFQGLPIEIFIAGRALREGANPTQMAKEFHDEFQKYWK